MNEYVDEKTKDTIVMQQYFIAFLKRGTIRNQNEEEATFFGKRTPSDGEIDCDRTKEDIRNWVRAQANPYPGAFTFYDNQKIIIDKETNFFEKDLLGLL